MFLRMTRPWTPGWTGVAVPSSALMATSILQRNHRDPDPARQGDRLDSPRIHRAPHQLVRYAPVLRACRSLPAGAQVLEVGSGVEGLGTWYRDPFVGVDLAFVGPILATLRPVIADGTRLPFPSRSVDVVACVDVLPELPRHLLAPICEEMARVCRGSVVVVSVAGSDADRSNARILAWHERHGLQPPA